MDLVAPPDDGVYHLVDLELVDKIFIFDSADKVE